VVDVRAGGQVGAKPAGGGVGGSPRKMGGCHAMAPERLAGMRDQNAAQGSGGGAGCTPGQVFGTADDGGTNQSSGPSSNAAPETSAAGLPGGGLGWTTIRGTPPIRGHCAGSDGMKVSSGSNGIGSPASAGRGNEKGSPTRGAFGGLMNKNAGRASARRQGARLAFSRRRMGFAALRRV
jgi:hypothetical protein